MGAGAAFLGSTLGAGAGADFFGGGVTSSSEDDDEDEEEDEEDEANFLFFEAGCANCFETP